MTSTEISKGLCSNIKHKLRCLWMSFFSLLLVHCSSLVSCGIFSPVLSEAWLKYPMANKQVMMVFMFRDV